jgi:hypothetical protein
MQRKHLQRATYMAAMRNSASGGTQSVAATANLLSVLLLLLLL